MQYPGYPIRRGEVNKTVIKVIQKRLNELSSGSILDDFSLEILNEDGDFGLQTEKAVKMFQLNFTDEDGQPLDIDGIVGPSTWASMFGSETLPIADESDSNFVSEVVRIAAGEADKKIREKPLGSNRGPEVDEYIKSVGLTPSTGSFPWCVAFVHWCFEQAAKSQGKHNPVFRTAGVHNLWNKSVGQTKVKRITAQQANANIKLVKPGQIFCMDFGSGRGHVGLVEAIKNGRLVTIEGNTNVGGSREGIGVFRRTTRRIEEIDLGFIDYSKV